MWSRVSLWVMEQDAAYRVDDRDGWVFHLADATGAAFGWKGIDYTGGVAASAPGYLDYEVPPGTYVAWATRTDGGQETDTHRAVVAVDHEPSLTVRLLPRPLQEPCDQPEPEAPCEVTVDTARGEQVRDGYPTRVVVQGTATCPQVKVAVKRPGSSASATDVVDVAADGTWTLVVPNDLKVECGGTVLVLVACTDDERCRAKAELTVECPKRDRKPKPSRG